MHIGRSFEILVGYRDPRDPDQETLAIEPTPRTGPLRRRLYDYVVARPDRDVSVDELRRFTLLETIYKKTETLRAVRRLIDDGQLVRADTGKWSGTTTVRSSLQEQLF